MMKNKYSQKISDVIQYSREEARRLKNRKVEPEHLLLGIIRDGENKAIEILKDLLVDLKNVRRGLEEKLNEEQAESDVELDFSEESKRILKISILETKLLKDETVDVEHLLLAIMRENENTAAKLLIENDVTYQKIMEQVLPQTNPKNGLDFGDEDEDESDGIRRQGGMNFQASESNQGIGKQDKKSDNDTPVLDAFGTDITKLAAEGKLDSVIGRDKEIERIAQILGRRKKNNPIIIGEPGVGKSAIVEGLALRIVEKKVSRNLFDKRVVALDLTGVVAGTKYRGQFEERMHALVNEMKKNPNVILFVDEIHTIVGAGSASGSMDAANILKPALARGEIQCIGATTLDEYRKNIEKDGALERRFQKLIVEPTTVEETLQILRNIKDKYEEYHNVNYTDEALEMCVKLTDRYITDRYFPDKAIDALDEAGSRAYLTNIFVPKEIEEQEKKIDEVKESKNDAVKFQNYELAASFRDKEKRLQEQLDAMKQDWEAQIRKNRETVDVKQISEVVSMITGVPVKRMEEAEGIRLRKMKQSLLSKVIGQDSAIDCLVRAIQRSRVGLKDPNRPIGTFMFLGPTGVGKTHLTKELAKHLFGSSDALIRVDMSEYMEKYSVSRMVGAPPGYLGYEDGGQLTEKVRRKPYSIVLLDEIEKAHPDVFNLLLQVMDEGRLTDGYGNLVDFRNTVIIMTSNIGTRQLKEFGKGIGFSSRIEAADNKDYSDSIIKKALNKTFAPEFINRIDEIITFNQLDKAALNRIIDIELEGLYQRVENLGYKLLIDVEAKNFIASKGYDVQYGARPLKRAIQNHLEDGLAEVILGGELKSGGTIHVSLNAESDALVMNIE